MYVCRFFVLYEEILTFMRANVYFCICPNSFVFICMHMLGVIFTGQSYRDKCVCISNSYNLVFAPLELNESILKCLFMRQ